MSLATNPNVNDTLETTVPYLPVETRPATPLDSPSPQQAVHFPSVELRDEIARIQTEEQMRIDREKQAELARLRDLARFD